MTYAATYFKTQDHDYNSFFGKYESTEKIDVLRAEVLSLSKALAEKEAAYSLELGRSYNAELLPVDKKTLFKYSNKNTGDFYYDATTGVATRDLEGAYIYNLKTKADYISVVVGYCLPLASVLVRHYKYSILSDKSKVSLKLIYEALVPVLGSERRNNYVCNYTPYGRELSENKNFFCYEFEGAMDIVNATQFIQNFFGIDREFNFSLLQLARYSARNKSYEVILRTAPEDYVENLLSITCEKAGPIHDIIGCSKADYNYAMEHGVLGRFIKLLGNFKSLGYHIKEEFTSTFSKTNQEWVDFLEKCAHWEDDLNFYNISYHTGDTNQNNLEYILMKSYVGNCYPIYSTDLKKNYPFGKFCSYVVEESVNQGYTSVKNFIKLLADYLNMCSEMNIVPTLYSSYLSQTHNITSRNHKLKMDEIQAAKFVELYKDFQTVNLSNGYSIVAPKTPTDVQHEGDALNHCVASYIKKIVDGRCMIYFLRKTSALETSLVTFEVRDETIVQAHGLHNRNLTNPELHALSEYAAKMKLKVRV